MTHTYDIYVSYAVNILLEAPVCTAFGATGGAHGGQATTTTIIITTNRPIANQ